MNQVKEGEVKQFKIFKKIFIMMNNNFSCLIKSDNLIIFFFSLPWYEREDQGCERERERERKGKRLNIETLPYLEMFVLITSN